MEYTQRKIAELMPYDKNAKKHDKKQIAAVAESIKRYGFVQPVVVDKDGVIVIGHCRTLAAKKLGLDTVPCVSVDDLSPEEVNALRLVDNKTNESPWDFDLLAESAKLADLDGFDLDFGLDEKYDTIVDEDNPPPEVPTETYVKVGEVYRLGEHRLMCGDSTDKANVEKLLDGGKADMVFTDPPYGIGANKMTMGSGKKVFYRGEDGWDDATPDVRAFLRYADKVCIWGGNYFADQLPISNDWLVWHKKNDGLTFSECELAWTNFGTNVRIIQHAWGGEKKQHVTAKPLEVIKWAIDVGGAADVVFDPFGGSGTTLCVCEQVGRTCYTMELSPQYCDVIIQRWENLTGRKAEKL